MLVGHSRPRQHVPDQLQRSQKIQYFLLLCAVEVKELLLYGGRFAAAARVVANRCDQAGGAAIVQQKDALSQAPQRRRAELISARAALRNVIGKPSSHVMDFNIRVRGHRNLT